jgi:hypothetical protein
MTIAAKVLDINGVDRAEAQGAAVAASATKTVSSETFVFLNRFVPPRRRAI